MIRIERACLDLLDQLKTCENVDEKLAEFKEFLFSYSLEAVWGPKIWYRIEKIRQRNLTK